MAWQVAVCGPAECTDDEAAQASRVGELLAAAGAVVICGGGGGVMAAVARGARSRDGLVVGVLPNDDRVAAAPDLSVALATNLGQARNAVIVWSADAVIAIGGSWGTLSEIALAKRRSGVPVISLGGWRLLDRNSNEVAGIDSVSTPDEAVRLALAGGSSHSP